MIDSLRSSKSADENLNKNFIQDHKQLIEIYEDKAKIEQFKENNDVAVDLVKEAILIAERM